MKVKGSWLQFSYGFFILPNVYEPMLEDGTFICSGLSLDASYQHASDLFNASYGNLYML